MLLIRPNQTIPKLLLRLMAITTPEEKKVRGLEPAIKPQDDRSGRHMLNHVPPAQLEHIIRQVLVDDYHVEYLSSFTWEESQPVEVMTAVTRWAKRSGLKVSINHERGICFFEKD
jgi:hypothetical protein